MSDIKESTADEQSEQHFPKRNNSEQHFPKRNNNEPAIHNLNAADEIQAATSSRSAIRRRLPNERHSLTHHFSIGDRKDMRLSAYTKMACQENSSSGWRRRARLFPA
jgi:hypothetical protein